MLGSHSLLGPRFSPARAILLRLPARLVPAVPAVLATEVKRQRYLAQRALGNREAQLLSEGRRTLATPLSRPRPLPWPRPSPRTPPLCLWPRPSPRAPPLCPWPRPSSPRALAQLSCPPPVCPLQEGGLGRITSNDLLAPPTPRHATPSFKYYPGSGLLCSVWGQPAQPDQVVLSVRCRRGSVPEPRRQERVRQGCPSRTLGPQG